MRHMLNRQQSVLLSRLNDDRNVIKKNLLFSEEYFEW